MGTNTCHMVTLKQICNAIPPPALYGLVPPQMPAGQKLTLHTLPMSAALIACTYPSALLQLACFVCLFDTEGMVAQPQDYSPIGGFA